VYFIFILYIILNAIKVQN